MYWHIPVHTVPHSQTDIKAIKSPVVLSGCWYFSESAAPVLNSNGTSVFNVGGNVRLSSRGHSDAAPMFWYEGLVGAGGHRLRLCLCGLLGSVIGNRCGKAGGWASSQSSWEKLKTTAFQETGGITVRWREGCKEGKTQGESFRTMWSLRTVSADNPRLDRREDLRGLVFGG